MAIFAGLAIAWGGTLLLISPAGRALTDPASPGGVVAGELLFWLLGAAVIAIVRWWERLPLASLWLRRVSWTSFAWGLALFVANRYVFFPAGEWVRHAFGLPGFAQGMEQAMAYPFWLRAFAVLGAGVVEEVLFRGYTVTRLAMLTRRVWLSAAMALVAFCLLHVPVWGWGFAVGGLVSGAGAMAFFVWRRDLLAMIVFHTLTDAYGILVAPMFSEWWRDPALL
jgi:CAAX protease family protein